MRTLPSFPLLALALCILAAPRAMSLAAPTKVIVTGASGRTGKLVFTKLLSKFPKTETIGLVSSEKSARKLMKESNCGLDQIVITDVTEISEDYTIPKALEQAETMVICTSAVPYPSKLSVAKSFMSIPFNIIRGKKAFNFRSLKFKYKPGQYPEKVDYEGQINQINLAKKLGAKQVVIVSSMGGTDPSNFLNTIGKNEDGTGNGDILLWKRKAERYLVDSGLDYTIIHPGGLRDTEGKTEKLILDVDDKLLKNEKRSINRSDVAELCLAALTVGKGKKVSFDCIAQEVEGEGSTCQSADEALSEFLEGGKTANYEL